MPKVDEYTFQRIIQLQKVGCTQKAIAERLGVTDRTVRTYLKLAKEGKNPFIEAECTTQRL